MEARVGVLFVQSQSYFGADSFIHSLLMKHLDRSRFSVHVACNPWAGDHPSPAWQALQAISNISLIPTRFGPSIFGESRARKAAALARGGRAAVDFPRLALHSRRNNIRIIHGTEKPRDVVWNLGLSKLVGAKSVMHLHVKCHQSLSPRARIGLDRANAIVGVSDFVAHSVVAAGYDARRVFSVRNGLDVADWTPSTGVEVRREFGLGSRPIVLAASRLFAWKGHRELLHAFARVRTEIPSAVLMIVGEDDQRAHPGGGSFAAELRGLCASLGVADSVVFTGFRRDVAALMAACDVFAMPSFEEPFGMVYLEAMAMERPVVALSNGGAMEVVEDGVTGLLSPPGDVTVLAQNLRALLAAPETRAKMGKAGRRRVEQCFSGETMARNIEHVYEELLERRGTVK